MGSIWCTGRKVEMMLNQRVQLLLLLVLLLPLLVLRVDPTNVCYWDSHYFLDADLQVQ